MKTRITMSDIARVTGMHQSTISLALSSDSRLRPSTIARIKAAADSLGYTPDPMLVALSSYRRPFRPKVQQSALAWLTNWSTREGWRCQPLFVQIFEAAQRRAAELGYSMENFWLNGQGLTPRRVSDILHARGVHGLLLAPQPNDVHQLEMDWGRFSVVAVGPTLRQPEFHLVSNNQYRAVTQLCHQLSARGYQRIGYSIPREFDDQINGQWSAAFDHFQRDLPPARRTARHEGIPTLENLSRWLHATRPDVVFSCHEQVADLLRLAQAKGAPPAEFALIGVAHRELGCAGMHEDANRVGITAVDRLTAMIRLGEKGVPAATCRTLIDATWVDAAAVEKSTA